MPQAHISESPLIGVKLLVLAFGGALAGSTLPAAAAPVDPSGLWWTHNNESIIKIAPCKTFYCGTLVWLKEPTENGKRKVDDLNQDASKRGRPMVGIELLIDLAPDKERWRGKAYNPDDGKTYDVTFKVSTSKVPNDTGEIEGCIFRIFCKSETFTRAQAIPLQGDQVQANPSGKPAVKQAAPAH
jgi:uncharacterized protein (DUF2147 family)